jgi:hypothetical protein
MKLIVTLAQYVEFTNILGEANKGRWNAYLAYGSGYKVSVTVSVEDYVLISLSLLDN